MFDGEKRRVFAKFLAVGLLAACVVFAAAGNWTTDGRARDCPGEYPVSCGDGKCYPAGARCCASTHACGADNVCCTKGCCPAGHPYACPSQRKCYKTAEEASIKCDGPLYSCK
jgi:hypothetical protein